jgi:hypothetical protein
LSIVHSTVDNNGRRLEDVQAFWRVLACVGFAEREGRFWHFWREVLVVMLYGLVLLVLCIGMCCVGELYGVGSDAVCISRAARPFQKLARSVGLQCGKASNNPLNSCIRIYQACKANANAVGLVNDFLCSFSMTPYP